MSTVEQTPVNVFQHPQLGLAVSGREVFAAVGNSKAIRDTFADWFRGKQHKLGLVEGQDFVESAVSLPNSPTARKSIEHILTIEAAKKVANIQTAKRGLGVVNYLKEYSYNATKSSEFTSPTGTEVKAEVVPLFAPTAVEPQPDSIPLTPIQKLLAEVQNLAAQEVERKNEPVVEPHQFKLLEARITKMERSLNTVIYFFQQSSFALRSMAPAQLPAESESLADLPDLEPTTRVKITRLVDGYAAAKMVTHQEVWKHLYGNLSTRYHFDAWVYGKDKKNPNYLEIVEENGQLENLYSIAVELLTLSQR